MNERHWLVFLLLVHELSLYEAIFKDWKCFSELSVSYRFHFHVWKKQFRGVTMAKLWRPQFDSDWGNLLHVINLFPHTSCLPFIFCQWKATLPRKKTKTFFFFFKYQQKYLWNLLVIDFVKHIVLLWGRHTLKINLHLQLHHHRSLM